MSDSPPYLILGNPENRRVTLFVEALRQLGQPEPRVVAHLDLLRDPSRIETLAQAACIVRLDSVGENAEVERELLALGYEDAVGAGVSVISAAELRTAPPAHGQILCPRQLHFGFLRYLGRLHEAFAGRPTCKVLSPPRDIAELFDKRLTSRRYVEAGIPVPDALPPVATPEALRHEMRMRGWDQVVVKLTSGSSASCLAVFRHAEVGTDSMMTTIEQAPEGRFNSLKLQRLDGSAQCDEVLSFLLQEGSVVERLVPKARLDGAYFDLRVLVVAGEPVFTVVRQSRQPITNLHLGGWRGEVSALQALVPDSTLQAAMQSCRAVWQQHSCFQVAIDLLIETDLSRHRVIEANAFGDLLPGLTRDGLSVYGWQIRQLGLPGSVP